MKTSHIFALLTVIAYIALPFTVSKAIRLIDITEIRYLAINIFLLVWCSGLFKALQGMEKGGNHEG